MKIMIVISAQRVKIKWWLLKIILQETPWIGTYTFTAIITLGDRKWSSVTLKWVGNKKKILQNVWLMWLSTKLPSLLLQGNLSRGIDNCFVTIMCRNDELSWTMSWVGCLQVNLCQKLLFLHQLTHNMTTDFHCSWKL